MLKHNISHEDINSKSALSVNRMPSPSAKKVVSNDPLAIQDDIDYPINHVK